MNMDITNNPFVKFTTNIYNHNNRMEIFSNRRIYTPPYKRHTGR